MAARRLLIIMVVLLAISTLAAALVPPPEERSGTSSTTTTTTSTTRLQRTGGGELVEAEVSAQDTKQNEPIELEPGDQLALVVISRAPGEVSLPSFGLIEFAGPGSPARFDLLVEKAGEYPVRFQGAGEVAKIVADQS
jgi:hypothetical protein